MPVEIPIGSKVLILGLRYPMIRTFVQIEPRPESDQERRGREKREVINKSLEKWTAEETELLADQTPLGGLRRALFDKTGNDMTVQVAFSNHGFFPGATESFFLKKINQGLNNWINSLTPEQKTALGLQTPNSIEE